MRGWLLAALMPLAACSSDPEPDDNRASATLAVPPPEEAAPVRMAPLRPGELPAPEMAGAAAPEGGWTFKASATGSAALFGRPGSDPIFSIRCDPQAREILFVRRGQAAAGDMRIVAATGAATYPIRAGDNGVPEAKAATSANDLFVTDTLARAEGKIGVRIGDGRTLALPAHPAIARVIGSCRSAP